jgi:cytochrome c peroxidase
MPIFGAPSARTYSLTRKSFARRSEALQAFQIEDPSFHPYDSKYDLYAGNKIGGDLTPQEQRGFAVYNDPEKAIASPVITMAPA